MELVNSTRFTRTVDESLEALKKAIWDRRPLLGDVIMKHQNMNLYEYAAEFMDVNSSKRLDARKPELIQIASDLIGERLGKEVAQRVSRQLAKLPLVSTADHHGIIQHPFFVNSNIISALPYLEYADPDVRSLIVFSFASVSLNCASNYTRGILFHGGMNGSGNSIRLPILPDKLKMGVVLSARGYTQEDLDRAKRELKRRVKEGEITEERSGSVCELLDSVIGAPEILSCPRLSGQITKINYRLWPRCFHPRLHGNVLSTKQEIPDLIYLEIETLVAELLLQRHLEAKSSLIQRFIFDSRMRELVSKHFNNIAGAFSLEKDWGTFIFWGIDEKLRRVRLRLRGDRIESDDGTISIELTPESVRENLQTKRIFPSMLLCYLVVSLYYGMKCLGGFCQVHDLTMTKKAWGNLLREIGETEEAEAVGPVQTRELGGDGLVLAYFRTSTGEMVPATGIDMAIDDINTQYTKYIDRSKHVTLGEMMNPLLPEIYSVLYAATERDPGLLMYTPEQILRATGLHSKLWGVPKPALAAK